jgi:HNH endonuclease
MKELPDETNRLKMEQAIKKLLQDSDKWKNAEKKRREFAKDFPLQKIATLNLDQYVIGKGRDNQSFCYRLEQDTDVLGRILGSPAWKFGVYYGHTKRDPNNCYRFAKRWGSNLEEAFTAVKKAIADLLTSAGQNDFQAVEKCHLPRLLKGKLLFIYYPEQYAPIYNPDDLKRFIAELSINGSFKTAEEMQRALMNWREDSPDLRDPVLYMHVLYEAFPEPGTTVGSEYTMPEEVQASGKFWEGAKTEVTINAYERNSKARAACITHHGCKCAACGFDFEKRYGAVGKGRIQVHHVTPIGKIRKQYEVDPKTDLIPVCPNCHFVIHLFEPPLSIEQVRNLLQ